MVRKGKHKKKEISYKKMIIFIIGITAILFIYNIFVDETRESSFVQAFSSTDDVFNSIEKNSYANIDRYIVYGTHLNLEGNIEINENTSVENAEIIAKDTTEEIVIDTNYTYNDNLLSFSTLKEINTGLNLEGLDTKNYYLLLKVEFSNNEIRYYSLSNNTEYGNIEYYTLTRNDENNKIDINFNTLNNIPILELNITKVNELPEDVYDIVIDPGHGGNDGGAVSGEYIESEIVLEYAEKLKTELENIGLKVLLTRDGTESPEEYTTYNIYDEDGRVTIANESHAKILLSLHMNSNEDVSEGGVEIYASPNSNLTFAKLLADNIVEIADTKYSQMETYEEEEGVYVRTIELENYRDGSRASFFRTYNGIFDSIPYLFIIREIGGIATGAYVDGRNSDYSENIYRNSNVGVEGYLIELGYINVDEDITNILRNDDLYVKAITDSISNFYEIK